MQVFIQLEWVEDLAIGLGEPMFFKSAINVFVYWKVVLSFSEDTLFSESWHSDLLNTDEALIRRFT